MPTSPFRILVSTIRENGVRSLYTGGTAFCVSNGAKSGVRFFSFDLIKSLFPLTREGKVPIHATLCAGLVAGMAESFAVLTPGETIKTRMIDDRAGPRVYKSTGHAVRTILAAEGLAGLYRGVWPVAMKQSANAMVRFTTFGTLKDHLGPQLSNMNLPASTICGSLAGAVTVYCTMPFDNVKTQLQSIQGRSSYSGSLDCARKLVARDGLARLWKGTSPRLVRLSVSSPSTEFHLMPLNQVCAGVWSDQLQCIRTSCAMDV